MGSPPRLSDESRPSRASFFWASFLSRWKSGMNPVVRHFAVFTLIPDHLLNASIFRTIISIPFTGQRLAGVGEVISSPVLQPSDQGLHHEVE